LELVLLTYFDNNPGLKLFLSTELGAWLLTYFDNKPGVILFLSVERVVVKVSRQTVDGNKIKQGSLSK
jgi:hypothetical protein